MPPPLLPPNQASFRRTVPDVYFSCWLLFHKSLSYNHHATRTILQSRVAMHAESMCPFTEYNFGGGPRYTWIVDEQYPVLQRTWFDTERTKPYTEHHFANVHEKIGTLSVWWGNGILAKEEVWKNVTPQNVWAWVEYAMPFVIPAEQRAYVIQKTEWDSLGREFLR